jgi:glycolate oxidase FAD binding subunit
MTVFAPRDAGDVEQAIQWALSADKALEIVGRGSKRGLGRPAQWDATLDLSALAGVTLYEPDELVLSARAGTPMADIEALCAANGQELAFEPMDYGPLLGGAAGQGTIGGALAVNASGPRRIKAGAARDHLLGVTAVSGRGETFKTGGRVVKNVTGYDLCKLLAGSFGTLAAMTEVTVKTLPRAETEASVVLAGLDAKTAGAAMATAMGSSGDVSGAAHLPAAVAQRALDRLPSDTAATVLRLEGVAPSVKHRRDALGALLRPFGAATVLEPEDSRRLWRAVRDVLPFAAGGPAGDAVVWRLSTAPSRGAEAADLIGRAGDAEMIHDWAGGLIWVAMPPSADGGAAAVRAAVAACDGHAMLVRAPAAIRAAADVFGPQGALAALNKRIKDGFDPKAVLNPGRMWAGV